MSLPFKKKQTGVQAIFDNAKQENWLKKAWHRGTQALNRLPAENASRMRFEPLEPRLLMSADLSFGEAATELTLKLDQQSNQFQLITPNTANSAGDIVSSVNITSALEDGILNISGNDANNILKLDLTSLQAVNLEFLGAGSDTILAEGGANFELSATALDVNGKQFSLTGFEHAVLAGGDSSDTFKVTDWAGSVEILGGLGLDTLIGPSANDVTWHINGADSGYVGQTEFAGVENLKGAENNRDTFVVGAAASLTGGVDGSAGGFDTLVFSDGSYASIEYLPTSPDSGAVVLDGTNRFTFAGLEPVIAENPTGHFKVSFSGTTNNVTVSQTLVNGSVGLLLDATGAEDFSLVMPTGSLTIAMGGGNLTFNGADLGAADLFVDGAENITVAGDVRAGLVDLRALKDITVSDNADITATDSGTPILINNQNDLTFSGNTVTRRNGVWSSDFARGQVVTITNPNVIDQDDDGNADNEGTFVLLGVSADRRTLTFDTAKPFTLQRDIDDIDFALEGGNVILNVDASVDMTWTTVIPFFRDKSAAASILVGDADLTGNHVIVTADSETSKFAEFEVDELALIPPQINWLQTTPQQDRSLSFNTNGAQLDTIVRKANSGSWLADGFLGGQYIKVTGSNAGNNGTYRIQSVTDEVLTLDASAALSAETDSLTAKVEGVSNLSPVMTAGTFVEFYANFTDTNNQVFTNTLYRYDGDWLEDGFEVGGYIQIRNVPEVDTGDQIPSQDGIYRISAIEYDSTTNTYNRLVLDASYKALSENATGDSEVAIIVAGAVLVAAALDLGGFDTLTVSDRGVRWGLLHDRFGAEDRRA